MLEFLTSLHGKIISGTVLVIVVWQTWMFISTVIKARTFSRIFPANDNKYCYEEGRIVSSGSRPFSSIFGTIVNSINNYLVNNTNAVSDFHLMKDIVDRNCDAREEEIHTQIPVPLYLGLVGTMSGILVGVIFFVFDGGLHALLTNSSGENDAHGIEALLGGVSMAMISSIFGIVYTTFGSSLTKRAKLQVEKNKNNFLSWIQAKLLPNIPNDVSSAIVKMTYNLSSFNDAFSNNSRSLQAILEKVNSSTNRQAALFDKINALKINDIATANIQVYEKLKGTTSEIGLLGGYLQEVQNYSRELQDMVINFQKYFAEEIAQIEQRKEYIALAVGKVDDYLKQAIQTLKENADLQLNEYKGAISIADDVFITALTKLEDHLKAQFKSLGHAAHEQQEILISTLQDTRKVIQEKFNETSSLVDELRNLTEIKKSVAGFEAIAERQNEKIDELILAIKETAQEQSIGDINVTTQLPEIPRWIKPVFLTVGGLVSAACLLVLIPALTELVVKLYNMVF